MTRPRHMRPAAATCACALLLAGCGGKATTIDHVTLEKAIEISVAQQRHQLVLVACPKGIKAKKGVVFTCSAYTAVGKRYAFRVTGKDSKGNVHYVGLGALPTP